MTRLRVETRNWSQGSIRYSFRELIVDERPLSNGSRRKTEQRRDVEMTLDLVLPCSGAIRLPRE